MSGTDATEILRVPHSSRTPGIRMDSSLGTRRVLVKLLCRGLFRKLNKLNYKTLQNLSCHLHLNYGTTRLPD